MLAGIFMWIISRHLNIGTTSFNFYGIELLILIFSLTGLLLATIGIISFKKSKTTINPTKPNYTTSLIENGIYRYTRNPMYLGLLFVLFSFGLYLKTLECFFILPFFIIFITKYQIIPEEEELTNILGDRFINYKTKVRRWI